MLRLVCVLGILLPNLATAQIIVGNGGDSVFCEGEHERFTGYYAVDYLATYDYANDNADLVSLPLEEQFDRIEEQLFYKATTLWASFRRYRQFLFSSNIMNHYVWRGHPYGLLDLDDENLVQLLPPHCYRGSEPGEHQVIQTIRREQRAGKVIFNYDSNIIDELRDREMQLSFLLVHEWLWDFVENAAAGRDFNRLLHSNQLETLSPSDLQLVMEQLGLQLVPERFREQRVGHRSILLLAENLTDTADSNTFQVMQRGSYYVEVYNASDRHVRFVCVGHQQRMEPGSLFAPTQPERDFAWHASDASGCYLNLVSDGHFTRRHHFHLRQFEN